SVHYRRQFEEPFGSAADFFSILLRACEAHKEEAPKVDKPHLRFMVDNGAILTAYDPFLPKRDDGGFEGYIARLDRMIGERDVTLVLNRAQIHDFELWRRTRAFLRGLFGRVDVPLYPDLVIWVSRARATTFGVHEDPYDNFLFPITGHSKRFRVWHPEVIKKRPEFRHARTYDAIVPEGNAYEVAP